MYNVSKHERLRPLLRNCVVLRFMCSVDDGNAVGMAAGNGEDDLTRRKKVCRGNLYFSERSCRGCTSAVVDPAAVGAAELGWTTAQQEREKPHKVFFDNYL